MAGSEDEAKRLQLVANERLKLAATYVNGLAIALFAVGSFGPIVAATMSSGSATARAAGIVAAVCAIVSAALHFGASMILKGLRP